MLECYNFYVLVMLCFILFVAAVQDYSRLGCLFIIVLTHGDEEVLYGTEGQAVRYEDFLYPLRAASTGKMEGIPKILLVQVCHSFVLLPAVYIQYFTCGSVTLMKQ